MTRIEDPIDGWAVVVFEHGRYRVTIADRPSFPDLEFASTDRLVLQARSIPA